MKYKYNYPLAIVCIWYLTLQVYLPIVFSDVKMYLTL